MSNIGLLVVAGKENIDDISYSQAHTCAHPAPDGIPGIFPRAHLGHLGGRGLKNADASGPGVTQVIYLLDRMYFPPTFKMRFVSNPCVFV